MQRTKPATARWFVWSLPVLLAVTGCSKPVAFSRGEAVPMGPYTLRVSYTESIADSPGTQLLAVHYRLDETGPAATAFGALVVFAGRIRVTDSGGDEYEALPMRLAQFRSRRAALLRGSRPFDDAAPSASSGEWVAVAKLPVQSRGLSLLITNPERRRGQPAVARVVLDR